MSNKIANLIAGETKTFSIDGDFFWKCILKEVKEIIPEQLELFTGISLSLNTKHIENIGKNI